MACKTLIVMDLNSRIGNDTIPVIMQRFNKETSYDNGNFLIELRIYNELRINKNFFKHKDQH